MNGTGQHVSLLQGNAEERRKYIAQEWDYGRTEHNSYNFVHTLQVGYPFLRGITNKHLEEAKEEKKKINPYIQRKKK